ncbi:MAG: hypothetical protein A2784_05030 [Candidatus Chisholmbacteria bacterium RIFCSPHIGHO2_01_FULL_48_12]|uniref:Uncharacterized protein n=1 Tax=Candidatus Chisholmbacteria bacterium RIFCSPHIGHO2_01_FULL_48_12 TaxID=1797589 RepID=A0A1G1VRM5_9BACT|nr:MAG: hypothetical protein A2784_05030 [Candidatus Chisholmbacteria bacterium RIFCSPHIGHO2_01_FULL_48_12]
MKLDKMVLANATAMWMAIVWVVCRVLVGLFPGGSRVLLQWWVHSVNLGQLPVGRMTWTGFWAGGITAVALAWLGGWLFGWCWELASLKRKSVKA